MNLTRWELSIAGVVAFIAWGFLTHWVPVIRILGYAFVAGSLFTGLGLIAVTLLSVAKPSRDAALDKSWGRAAIAIPSRWKQDTEWLRDTTRYKPKVILPASPEVSENLDELLEWVLRDFVTTWYGNISSSPKFINEIDAILRDVMIEFRNRIESIDIVEAAVLRFVPIITAHMKDFYEAEQSVRGKKLNKNVTESEELDLAIAAKYRDGRLHPAASLAFTDTAATQAEYLRKIVARLLPILVPADIVQSKAVSNLVREIIACAVLSTIVRMLADPDTWNQILEGYGKTMLHDRKTVRKLRAALDEHASSVASPSKQQPFPRLSPDDDDRKFERFIRAIRQCNNLSDARRFRNEVSSQLTRESMKEGQHPSYIRRLETGKRILDQRIGMLSAIGGSTKSAQSSEAQSVARSAKAQATAVDILRDTSGLSYFMEYMDRQHLMTLVQFWLVVDGFRNPLEDDHYDDPNATNAIRQWNESDRLDIAQISEAYMSKSEIRAPVESREVIKDFLKSGKSATMNQYLKARAAILRAQTNVQEELEERHLQGFRKSDLFYKYLNSEGTSTKSQVSAKSRPKRPEHSSSDALIKKAQLPAVAIQRVNSAHADLKRSPRSATDLKTSLLGVDHRQQSQPRRSLDHSSGPLFNDDIEPEHSEPIRRSFDVSSANGDSEAGEQEQVVEAVEAALNTIMTDEPVDGDLSASQPDLRETQHDILSRSLGHAPLEFGHHSPASEEKRSKPNLASLGLVGRSGRTDVFKDNDLFGDEGKFLEDDRVGSDGAASDKDDDGVHEAEPGDLGLAEAISALTMDIDKLVSQEAIVDTLTRKAELTNNVAELRILGKSKASLQREIRRKELQRQQYMVQEGDNSLFGRASIDITSVMTGKEDDGQEFAIYVISVKRQAGEHMAAATWAVARRYSEFHKLHQRLRALYPTVRTLEFPRRRLVMKLQNDFLEKRRVSLEHYLRELLRLPAVCRSRDLRAFLSQRPILSKDEIQGDGDRADIVSRIYNSVTDGMDEFLGNIPVLDQLSLAGQNLISAATSQYNANNTVAPTAVIPELHGIDDREARTELDAFDNQTLEPLVKPISEIFLETFELNKSANWLRGRAVVVVLHQLLGGTVERKVRETAKALFSDESLLKYLAIARDAMWPGGVLQRDKKPRTEMEKRNSRREASVVLAALIPELAGSIVGRANAQAASRRLFATLNNSRLNTHLVFKLLDEAIAVLFPDSIERSK